MSELAELQAALAGAILADAPEMAARHVAGDARASAERRVAVYCDAYRLRLVGVLARDFDGLLALAGDTGFRALALDYLAAHPSRHASVRELGHALADFLAQSPRWSARPELAEMARFEWLWGRAFDAADAPPVGGEALAGLPAQRWGGLGLGLHPSLQRVTLATDVPVVFLAVTRGEPPPVPAPRAATWILWRPALEVRWRSLADDEAAALEAFATGARLAEVCEQLARWHAQQAIPARIVALMGQWLGEGLVVRVTAD